MRSDVLLDELGSGMRSDLLVGADNPATFSPMVCKPRLDVRVGFYHVLTRGNRRGMIFHDDADYRAA